MCMFPFFPTFQKGTAPLPPYIENAAIVGTYNTSIGSIVLITCSVGHKFSDGTTERRIKCLENKEWEQTEQCLGRKIIPGSCT